jgi:hypothetical protein
MGQRPNPNDLEHLFRHEVLKMLKAEGKINEAVIENMLSWHHSGFNVYCGSAIWPRDEDALEKLARYIIRAAFSQERMTYIHDYKTSDNIANVIYRSKDGRKEKTFHALDWLAQLTTHIPNKREQMVRYYGYYSNKSRGLRKKVGKDDDIPAVIHPELSPEKFRKNWARLIQKIYEIDPLVCPRCQGEMRIIAFIEFPHIIKRILEHLGLWLTHNHDPPAPAETTTQLIYDDEYSQIPPYDDWIQ